MVDRNPLEWPPRDVVSFDHFVKRALQGGIDEASEGRPGREQQRDDGELMKTWVLKLRVWIQNHAGNAESLSDDFLDP